MKSRCVCVLLFSLMPAADGAEKIRDVSPDKKFAVCIRYEGAASSSEISSEAVHAVEVVSLPEKQSVAQLLGERASGFSLDQFKLVWSPDSKAFAFSVDDVRTSVVTVEELQDGKFAVANDPPDDLQIELEGAFTQYVRPVRWIKPGELLLEEVAGFRDGNKHTTLQLTAKKDAATGKYKIVSHRKLASTKRK